MPMSHLKLDYKFRWFIFDTLHVSWHSFIVKVAFFLFVLLVVFVFQQNISQVLGVWYSVN